MFRSLLMLCLALSSSSSSSAFACDPPGPAAQGLFDLVGRATSTGAEVDAYLQHEVVAIDAKNSRCDSIFALVFQQSRADLFSALFLDYGKPDLNQKFGSEASIFENALSMADLPTLTVLEGLGASFDKMGGENPLSLAALNPHPEVITSLIQHGFPVNAPVGDSQQTPLMIAAANNSNLAVVQILLDAGADVRAVDKAGDNLLFMAVLNPLGLPVLKLFLPAGLDASRPDSNGNSILSQALYVQTDPQVILALVKAGADPAYVATDGYPVLNTAMFSSKPPAILGALIDAGAKVNGLDAAGETPLIIAAKYSSKEDIELLLRKGANRGFTDGSGESAYSMAVQAGREAGILALLKDPPRPKPHKGKR